MHEFDLLSSNLPRGADADRIRLGYEKWSEAVDNCSDPTISAFADRLNDTPESRIFLESIFGNSPYLTLCIAHDPHFTKELLTQGWDCVYAKILDGLSKLQHSSENTSDISRKLRIAKRRAALTIAAADIACAWPVERVTTALSDFADAAICVSAAHVLREAAANDGLQLAHADNPEKDSGLVILGMGKLGSRELNYSSDVDLIVLFDADKIKGPDPDRILKIFVRLTRNLVRLLDERTRDGYVFRTDLRLRPDPASTPPALSVLAAELYYESLGQNWERAAMIKARPVAGDLHAGSEFIKRLKPYVWRKHLDFAAIQDIHSIKRQIDVHRGSSEIAVAGHNVKLGRGGIREIEFYVQTQQLIWGGRQPEVRTPGTLDALGALAKAGHINENAAHEMAAAYRYLRRVEHRIQMVNDEQTHSVPQDPKSLDGLSVFLGYPGTDEFATDLEKNLRCVEGHYAELFEDTPNLTADGTVEGNLVFTGSDPDPQTLRTLMDMGYGSAETLDSAVRGWHHGRYRAMRSARARELLTELMPALLSQLAKNPDPDTAFRNFDSFLSALPAGVQLFSMFYANPHLLELVAEIMGGAPRLAQHLSLRPTILDSVLAGDFFDAPPPARDLTVELTYLLSQGETVEDALDTSRRWAHDRQFQIGVQLLRGYLASRAASVAFSNIADIALKGLFPIVEGDFSRKHGRFPGSGMSCIALGKLGSREMTPTSDLDIIFVYEIPPSVEASDGPRPLPPSQYFARLSQRLINAITAQTAEGRLYEVDMRLRPSGAAGPIASSLEAFIQYHEDAAWTWEHMALSRARIVFGPDNLRRKIEQIILATFTRQRNSDVLLRDVAEMRARMDAEHHSDFIWEVKHLRGGLVDIDFIAQYLQLRYAHDCPGILAANTRTALRALRDNGYLDAPVADELVEALDLWQAIQGILRLTIEGTIDSEREAEVTEGLQKTLAQVGSASDVKALKEKMRTMAARSHEHFRKIVAIPASKLPPGRTG